MGKMMGAFEDDNDMLDRPDLNKCPDCGCFFAQDNCPLCGKLCPEEMRAGNRAAPKKQKYKYDNGYRTVMFVDWYHRWWFIALMAFVFPLAAIVLLITSPYKKKQKIIAVIVAVSYSIITTFAIPLMANFYYQTKEPVNTSLSREEYTRACSYVTPEDFYRSSEEYKDKFVSMELTIKDSFSGEVSHYFNKFTFYSATIYDTYYLCSAEDANGNTFNILIRDCLQENPKNFIPGEKIVVYGEGAGNVSVYEPLLGKTYSAPCINMAYSGKLFASEASFSPSN